MGCCFDLKPCTTDNRYANFQNCNSYLRINAVDKKSEKKPILAGLEALKNKAKQNSFLESCTTR